MLGSLADRTEEAGSAVAPLTLMLVAVYIVSLSTLETPIGAVLSIIPISSPIVMPARIAIGAATPIQIVASLSLLAIAVVAAARLANLVYARALVRTGKRLRLIDVLRTPK
jgi:ABC-2 type transport system permease protein